MHPKLPRFVYQLDDIAVAARKEYPDQTASYIAYIVEKYTDHWRYLQADHMDEIQQNMWNELYFIEQRFRYK